MDILKEFDLLFNEKKESGPHSSDSYKRKERQSDSYLSKSNSNRWDNIPSELKSLNQWVTWKPEIRDGKTSKVPYQPNGLRASSINRDTWYSFTAVQESENVGFVFTDDDPFVFIDIDGNKETGTFSPSASFWISKFDSYTEVSPSKTGYHIIIKGKKNFPNCRRGDFEIYEKDRFATFTGDVYQSYTDINERQEVLDRLHRALWGNDYQNLTNDIEPKPANPIDIANLIEKDEKFARLWSGDVSGFSSNSEADLALCEKLAFYGECNPSEVERLFRESGLVRDKWMNRPEYRKQTIEKAISGIKEGRYSSAITNEIQSTGEALSGKFEYPKPIPLTEIMQREFNPRKDVIQDLIPCGLTLTMAAEKIGKSSMFRQVGYSVATGQKCFGGSFAPAVSGHVLYLSFEDDDHSIKESMELFCQDSAPANYHFQYNWPKIGKGCIRALEAYVSDYLNTKLIIIDTWAYIRSKDNGKTSFGRYNEDIEDLNKLKQFANKHNLSIIISTHTKKAKEDDWARNVHGGIGQTATADTIIFIDRKRSSSQGFFHITGKRIKDKSLIAEFEHRSWMLKENNKFFNLTPVMQEYWDVFVENENRKVTPKEFVEMLYPDLNETERDKKDDRVRQQLSRMAKSKKLNKVERSYYKMFTSDYESYKNVKEF
jgi:RecA-family ATPase